MEWSRLTYKMDRDLVEAGKNDEFNRLFDKPYDGLHPTKIPAGRIEVALPAGQDVSAFELSLADAQAHVRAGDAASIDTFFSAAERVALMRIPGAEAPTLAIVAPAGLAKLGRANPRHVRPASGEVDAVDGFQPVRDEDRRHLRGHAEEGRDGRGPEVSPPVPRPRSYSHRKKSTGGISSRKLSTIRISISGRNHRAHRSHGTFAAPSTPIVTALVGRIGLTNSHSW